MRKRISFGCGFLVVLLSLPVFSQQRTTAANAPVLTEWPITLQQKIASGMTPVGSKVQAKLLMATMINGTVVPPDAIFSGEVTESQPKSADAPAKLGIRMDSVQWKNGGPLAVKLYVTEWCYPYNQMNRDAPATEYPHGKIGMRAPGPQDQPGAVLERPRMSSQNSARRVRIKDVEGDQGNDGALVLTSQRSTIKLDKSIIYVLAAGKLP